MKPFDLHKALQGSPVVTREGEPVKIIAHVPDVVAFQRVLYQLGLTIFSCNEQGQYSSTIGESSLDLFMAEPAVTDHIPTSEYYRLFMDTTNHVQYAIEVEHLVREHCAKIAESFPFSPNVGREIAKRIRDAANG